MADVIHWGRFSQERRYLVIVFWALVIWLLGMAFVARWNSIDGRR